MVDVPSIGSKVSSGPCRFDAKVTEPPRVGVAANALEDTNKLPAVVADKPSAPIAAQKLTTIDKTIAMHLLKCFNFLHI